MAITRTAWIDDDGSGTTGTVINNAEKTLLYNQIDAAIASGSGGTPNNRVFDPTDYSGRAPLVWTTSATNFTNVYAVTGKLVTWGVSVQGATTGSADPIIYVKVPVGGWVASHSLYFPMAFATTTAGGATKAAFGYILAGQSTLSVQLLDGTNWLSGAYIDLHFTIQILVN